MYKNHTCVLLGIETMETVPSYVTTVLVVISVTVKEDTLWTLINSHAMISLLVYTLAHARAPLLE